MRQPHRRQRHTERAPRQEIPEHHTPATLPPHLHGVEGRTRRLFVLHSKEIYCSIVT